MKPIALPDLLVEYLVTGALALLWLTPLLGVDPAAETPTAVLVALSPGLYAPGMAVDFAAFLVVSLPRGLPGVPPRAWNIKSAVRRFATRRRVDAGGGRDAEVGDGLDRGIRLRLEAPEIAAEIAMRSSRDRVARGAWMNLLLVGLVLSTAAEPAAPPAAAPLAFAGAALCFVMWAFFEANSFVYELRVDRALARRGGPD